MLERDAQKEYARKKNVDLDWLYNKMKNAKWKKGLMKYKPRNSNRN